MFRVTLAPRADRAFRNLSPEIQRRIDPALQTLAQNPRPSGCKKLAGETSVWRIRVGDYRIVYEIQDEQLIILVLKVAHRREIYRKR